MKSGAGDTGSESIAIERGRGLWGDAATPKEGWRCSGVVDLGRPTVRCGMCRSMTIRYAHKMTHPSGKTLVVGCVCAGHMQGDLAAASGHDAWVRSRAGKKRRWPSRRWRQARSGNWWTRVDGVRVTVFRQGAQWSAVATMDGTDLKRFLPEAGQSLEQVKAAAFDLVTEVLHEHRFSQSGQPTKREASIEAPIKKASLMRRLWSVFGARNRPTHEDHSGLA